MAIFPPRTLPKNRQRHRFSARSSGKLRALCHARLAFEWHFGPSRCDRWNRALETTPCDEEGDDRSTYMRQDLVDTPPLETPTPTPCPATPAPATQRRTLQLLLRCSARGVCHVSDRRGSGGTKLDVCNCLPRTRWGVRPAVGPVVVGLCPSNVVDEALASSDAGSRVGGYAGNNKRVRLVPVAGNHSMQTQFNPSSEVRYPEGPRTVAPGRSWHHRLAWARHDMRTGYLLPCRLSHHEPCLEAFHVTRHKKDKAFKHVGALGQSSACRTCTQLADPAHVVHVQSPSHDDI